MEHQARPGIPRKRVKNLQNEEKPLHTLNVKDPPAALPTRQVKPLQGKPVVPVVENTHGDIRHIPKKHKTAIDAEFQVISCACNRPKPGSPGYAQWFANELQQKMDVKHEKHSDTGYDPINRTNVFEKSQSDPVPGMLTTGDKVTPERPLDAYMRTDEYKRLSPIRQEFLKSIGS